MLFICLFFVFLAAGFYLSSRKPLWTDEIFTQVTSIDPHSYLDVLSGQLPGEDNLCPLYYLIHKAACDLTGYRFPQAWDGVWSFSDHEGQMKMRIPSIIFMATALAGFVTWGSALYGAGGAIIAAGLSLSSFMVWAYVAEARPYALWFLLSLLQIMVWFKVIDTPSPRPRWVLLLLLLHLFLALTIVFSIGQIVLISLLIAISKRDAKAGFVTGILPAMIVIYYLSKSMGMTWWTGWLPSSSEVEGSMPPIPQMFMAAYAQVIKAFPVELVFLGLLLMIVISRGGIFPGSSVKVSTVADRNLKVLWSYLAGLWFYAWIIVAVFMFFTNKAASGAVVQDRYFIFLNPAALIAGFLSGGFILQRLGGEHKLRWAMMAVFSGLWVNMLIRTVLDLTALGIY